MKIMTREDLLQMQRDGMMLRNASGETADILDVGQDTAVLGVLSRPSPITVPLSSILSAPPGTETPSL